MREANNAFSASSLASMPSKSAKGENGDETAQTRSRRGGNESTLLHTVSSSSSDERAKRRQKSNKRKNKRGDNDDEQENELLAFPDKPKGRPLLLPARSNTSPPQRANRLTRARADSKLFSGGAKAPVLTHETNALGEIIFKGHPSWILMLDIQTGIKNSTRGNSIPFYNELVDDVDPRFFAGMKALPFPAQGSEFTIPHTTSTFKFKDYCPRAFSALREYFGITDDVYQVAFHFIRFTFASHSLCSYVIAFDLQRGLSARITNTRQKRLTVLLHPQRTIHLENNSQARSEAAARPASEILQLRQAESRHVASTLLRTLSHQTTQGSSSSLRRDGQRVSFAQESARALRSQGLYGRPCDVRSREDAQECNVERS
jgi:hypothetical protein